MIVDCCAWNRFAAVAVVCLCVIVSACPAVAYRPFDGTDAAVADFGEVEIEFGPAGAWRADSHTTATGPNAVFNYGFAREWELVLQGETQAPPEGAGPSSVPNGLFFKHVIVPGVLQDKPGPSVAVEFGTLLPDVGQPGIGLGVDAIMSQRWAWGTVHLNLQTNLTHDQHDEVLVDSIVEGPNKWMVRPVAEFYSDTVVNQAQTWSALIGAIWQARDNLAFDVALRHAWVNGEPVTELRAGVTFGFNINLGRPAAVEPASGLPPGRR